ALTVIALLVNEGLTINEAITVLQVNPAAIDTFHQNTMISFVLAFFVWIWLLVNVQDNKLTIKLADKFEK
ncbi:MAG: hypothetical protein ACOVP1_13590, partial [Bacteroidia bacterium]